MAKSRINKLLILFLNIILYLIYGNYFLCILLTSIGTFYLGKEVKKNKSILLVIFSYLLILLPLIFFKYLIKIYNFNLLIPLGISYYSLSLISYISDLYHDKYSDEERIENFLLFSLFFPCLFIGPINRYNDFKENSKNICFKKNNFFLSILRITLGLVKKFVIANKLNIIISTIASNTNVYTGGYVLLACFIYSVLLYMDFSGGIDIVLGLSKMFNVTLVENFDHPYKSQSIKEFWRRWHISLSSWLKDYIYIPLGGNRVNKIMVKVNVLITFIISGLWHGIHYLLWGFINGIMVILNIKTKNKYLNIFLTFVIISLLWIFFIYNDTFLAIRMFISVFSKWDFTKIGNLGLDIVNILIILITLIIVIIYENKKEYFNSSLMKLSDNKKMILILGIILLILIFGNYGLDVNSNNFIYGSF